MNVINPDTAARVWRTVSPTERGEDVTWRDTGSMDSLRRLSWPADQVAAGTGGPGGGRLGETEHAAGEETPAGESQGQHHCLIKCLLISRLHLGTIWQPCQIIWFVQGCQIWHKMGQICPKLDKSGTFTIWFSLGQNMISLCLLKYWICKIIWKEF